jgi:hypothetical protein
MGLLMRRRELQPLSVAATRLLLVVRAMMRMCLMRQQRMRR